MKKYGVHFSKLHERLTQLQPQDFPVLFVAYDKSARMFYTPTDVVKYFNTRALTYKSGVVYTNFPFNSVEDAVKFFTEIPYEQED